MGESYRIVEVGARRPKPFRVHAMGPVDAAEKWAREHYREDAGESGIGPIVEVTPWDGSHDKVLVAISSEVKVTFSGMAVVEVDCGGRDG